MRPSESQKPKRTVVQGHKGLVQIWVGPALRDAINEDKHGLETQHDVISRWHDSVVKLSEMKVEA